ncbi:hypothetical protein DMUE_5954, partial [Dictyocoela muelleri]
MNHDQIIEIKSKREKTKILHNGYSYTLHRNLNDTYFWKCIDSKCSGIIKINNKNFDFLKNHTCIQSFDKNEALYLNYKSIKRTLLTNERHRDIISKKLGIMTSQIPLFLPTTKNYVDKLTKIRRKNNIIFERDDIPISAKITFS